jgi:hypothetical protein
MSVTSKPKNTQNNEQPLPSEPPPELCFDAVAMEEEREDSIELRRLPPPALIQIPPTLAQQKRDSV